MKTMLALAATLIALSGPAFAAEAPTFASCDGSAVQKGIEDTGAYKTFMVDCLSDPPPGVAQQVAAQRTSLDWQTCEDLAMSRGLLNQERRSVSGAPSEWKLFMDACLAGRVSR